MKKQKPDFQDFLPPDLPLRIASNVRAFRRMRHISQTELARRVGVLPGPMNAIEQGKHVPTGRMLFRLAGALDVSVDDILGRAHPERPGPQMYVAESAAAPYAADARPCAIPIALPPEDLALDDKTRLIVDKIVNSFLALEDLCGAQKRALIPLYMPFTPDETGIEMLAGQVRQALGIGQGVIFDYLELLENAGLRLIFCPLPGVRQSLACYDAANANAFIVVRSDMNVERQIFEMIKRLGAIYLKTLVQFGAPADNNNSGLLDDLHAARKFAALFLMPAAAVRASVAQLGIGPSNWTYDLMLRIKHRFGVSAQSFVYRLKELKLIDEGLARGFDDKIKAYYDRTSFGEPDSTRRMLSPNGRLGDLLLAAMRRPASRPEAKAIAKTLSELGVQTP